MSTALISVVSTWCHSPDRLTLDQRFGIYGLAVAFLVGWFLQAAVQVPCCAGWASATGRGWRRARGDAEGLCPDLCL